MCGNIMDVLSEEQQVRLNQAKVELRLENERYIRAHPELRQLFKHFMAVVLEEKPDNVQEFAANFFTQDNLRDVVL